MTWQQAHRKTSSSSSTPKSLFAPQTFGSKRPEVQRSQFAPRPFAPIEQKLTPEDIADNEFPQNKFETTRLEIQAKYSTITPSGQERLNLLQAKMDDYWVQRRERKQHLRGFDLANISINRPDATPSQPIQAKLTVGAPGDKYEQEADAMASQVMSMPDSAVQREIAPEEQKEEEVRTKPLAAGITPLVQREAMPEEEEIQAKPLGNATIQREAMPEDETQTKPISASIQRDISSDEEEVQTKPALQRATDGSFEAGGNIESRLNSSKGRGSPLPNEVRGFMEPRFGADFSQVRVHTGGDSVQMNRELGAQAFTHGSDVYFGAGKSLGNNELTAHELTHVVQQTGAVQRNCRAGEKEVQTKSLAAKITPLVQREAMSNILLQLKHLSIPETVANFKNLVTPDNENNSSPTLVESGQFYWTNQIQSSIGEYINGLRYIPAIPEWGTLLTQCEKISKKDFGGDAKDIETIRKAIADIRQRASKGSLADTMLLPLLPFVEPLLKPALKSGKAIYYELWSHLHKGDQIPSLDPYRSLPTLQAIWSWENQACGYTGSLVANRYTRKGGAKKANPDAKRKKSTGVWAMFSASASRDMRPTTGGFRQGDVLIQNGVSGAIPKMQAALDDGWILHARVLSGVDYGHGEAAESFDKQAAKGKAPKQPQHIGKPPEEHSIMIIGYDGNEFVFWDPDSASSNRRGSGFGSLFFSNDRLSTAKDNADIVVNNGGDHPDGNHRYQIINLGSQ